MTVYKLIIVGSCGQLGNYLFHRATQRGISPVGTWYTHDLSHIGRHYLDITHPDDMITFFKGIKPDVMIFPAFNPNVDYCESNPRETRRVNLDPIPYVLDFCKSYHVKFFYYSTDYVFDGKNGPYTENAPVNPLSEYGHQKLTVERMIQNVLDDYIIGRISWVYGWELGGKNFVVRLVHSLLEENHVKIPSDQLSNPTYAGNIADLSYDLIEKNFNGIINIADCDIMSRYEFAVKVAEFYKCNIKGIESVETRYLGQKAKRPLRAGYVLDKIESILGKGILKNLPQSLALMESEKGII